MPDADKPKIAALLPHTGTYGGVRRYIEMGNQFARRGYDYAIYTPEGNPPGWIEYKAATKPLSRIQADAPDIIICGDVGLLPRFVKMKARLKIMNLLGSRFADKYRRHLRDDTVVAGNSIEWKEYLPDVEGRTIAGGVNPDIFRPLGLPRTDDAFRVMCFGRKSKKYKGTETVVRAFRRLRPRKAFRLVMFDNRRFNKPWFVHGENHWGLTQMQLATLYNMADVFVSAEYGAGWSNTSAEAMACRIPVICTKSGTQDFAIYEQTALVIPFDSPLAIAEAIYRLKEDTSLRKRIAEAGWEKIREFTWEHVCDKFEALFAEKGLINQDRQVKGSDPFS
ncbi:MAG: glycosyltransferase family 4 protein [Planctomycetota bacterium]